VRNPATTWDLGDDGDVSKKKAPSIVIIILRAANPDEFEAIPFYARKEESSGWMDLPARSGRYLDTFLMKATGADFSLFQGAMDEDEDKLAFVSCLIGRDDVVRVLPALEALVAKNADKTARALRAHGGNKASLASIKAALASGKWPDGGDPAEEAAAFAHHLLAFARTAVEYGLAVCLEYHGDFVA